jgi:hypothetical protein
MFAPQRDALIFYNDAVIVKDNGKVYFGDVNKDLQQAIDQSPELAEDAVAMVSALTARSLLWNEATGTDMPGASTGQTTTEMGDVPDPANKPEPNPPRRTRARTRRKTGSARRAGSSEDRRGSDGNAERRHA